MEGILVHETNKRNTFAYIRTVKGVEPLATVNPRAAMYVDIEGDKIDVEAYKKLADLRDNQIPGCMPNSHISKWQLDVDNSGIMNDLSTDEANISKYAQKLRGKDKPMKITKYKNYLDDLSQKVEDQVKGIIDNVFSVPHLDSTNTVDQLCDTIALVRLLIQC